MSDLGSTGRTTSRAPGARARQAQRRTRTRLWSVVATAIAVAWWIALTPVMCAAQGAPNVLHAPCPSAADRLSAAGAITGGYACLVLVGTLALRRARSRAVGLAVLLISGLAAIPAWLWVGQSLP